MLKKLLSNLDMVFGCTALVLVIAMTFVNVVCRYVLGFIITPFEELSLILFVWLCYIGASVSYRSDGHIAIDAIYNLMPAGVKKGVDLFIDLVGTATCLYTTYLAWVICANLGDKVTTLLRLPFVVYNGAIVVSFALMSVYSVIKLTKRVKKLFDPQDGLEEGADGRGSEA